MSFIKSLIPDALLKVLRPIYHGLVAITASLYFGQPSNKMIVIGVTGTAGKSTTVQMLSRILNSAGKKCGFITTVSFFNGQTEFINKHGLSMPGGWLLQKQLREMVKNGCTHAIVECTSEGLAQNRHLGIKFVSGVFTNLSEAHIEAHGSFENYRKAKGKLFEKISNFKFQISNKNQYPKSQIPKTLVANLDDANAEYFLGFEAEQKVGISFEGKTNKNCPKIYQAEQNQTGFNLEGINFEVKLIGKFNHYNALLATAAANALGVSLADCANAISSLEKIRGRMEPVPNDHNLTIIVDYGCEPETFKAALLAVKYLPHKRIIHVFGSTGGHRDKQKRFIFGKTSAQYADYIIITNDDIYDSDPKEIAENIESGIKNYELRKSKYEIILDRRAAIARALQIAEAGDIVLFTGKSSEQFLVLLGNKRIEWDEVSVVREELNKISAEGGSASGGK